MMALNMLGMMYEPSSEVRCSFNLTAVGEALSDLEDEPESTSLLASPMNPSLTRQVSVYDENV